MTTTQKFEAIKKEIKAERDAFYSSKENKSAEYRVLVPEVTVENYFQSTDVVFAAVAGSWTSEDFAAQWEALKSQGEWHKSPKSDSEYIIMPNGDIYRLADHWGLCASCMWDIDTNGHDGSKLIGKAHISEFKGNKRGGSFLPQGFIERRNELNAKHRAMYADFLANNTIGPGTLKKVNFELKYLD